MRLIKLWTAALLLCGAQLWADVSFVTGFRIEPGPGMPPAAVEKMARSMPAMPVIRTRIKGTRSTARAGGLDMIIDGAKQEITLLDTASKTFAVGAMADYLSAVGKQMPKTPKMPAEVEQMMAGMQMASRKTDRTDVIEGIKAGEREISLSLKLPLPATPPADGTTPAAPPAVEMKIVMHLWTALPGEIDRVPALRELDGVMSSGNGSMFGRDFIQQLSVMLPFAGDSMTKLMEELSKDHAYPLRTQMDLSMPGMAEMLAQLGPSGAGGSPDFPKGPLMSMTMEVTEWSTAAIDEAVFQVPQDYKPAPFADLLKKLNK